MSWILGINAWHADASACLLRDGEIVAAAEEERFCRVKHWAGFPDQAMRWCLEAGGIGLDRLDHVAVNTDPRANWGARVRFVLRTRPGLRALWERLRQRRRRGGIEAEIARAAPGQRLRAQLHRVEHHLAHLASAALVSPFERCLALSVDQFGDFASTAWGFASGAGLSVEGRVDFPHSLGTFYSAITQLLGFPHYGDEYKVMGLAPYGEPRYLPEMRRVLRAGAGSFELDLRYFRHHRESVYEISSEGLPVVRDLFAPELEQLLGPRRATREEVGQRHKDLARSAQVRYEEVLFELLRGLHRRYAASDLALAGGCGMNSVANGKIHRETPFRRVWVQAAAGDAGGALGAALAVHARERSVSRRRFVMRHAYLGPAFGDAEVEHLLGSRAGELEAQGCRVEAIASEDELCMRTARALAEGQVVGWFQGRLEWGPRALGNRSILCDPRRPDMKQLLNAKIKRRESFRPFAPSVLREAVAEWFEDDGDVPFMTHVFPIRTEKRALIPAVTHVDGSGRLQTVTQEENPLYHRLISAFAELTGVPMLLNTSFNENEPVVCRPVEALECFLRTDMDLLVVGRHRVSRRDPHEARRPSRDLRSETEA